MHSGCLTCSFWRPSLDELISMINSPFRQRLADRTRPTLSSWIAARIAATYKTNAFSRSASSTMTLFTGILCTETYKFSYYGANALMMMARANLATCAFTPVWQFSVFQFIIFMQKFLWFLHDFVNVQAVSLLPQTPGDAVDDNDDDHDNDNNNNNMQHVCTVSYIKNPTQTRDPQRLTISEVAAEYWTPNDAQGRLLHINDGANAPWKK